MNQERDTHLTYPPITDFIGGRIGCGSIVTLLLLFWLTLATVVGGCNVFSNDPITFAETDSIVVPGQIEFSGQAEPNEDIVLIVNDLEAGTTRSNAAGTWRINTPLSIPGAYDISANYFEGPPESESTAIQVVVPEPITIDGEPTIGNRRVSEGQVRVPFGWSGTAQPGSLIRLLNSDGQVLALADVDTNGNWEIDRNINLNPGDNFLLAAMDWEPTETRLGISPQVRVTMPQIGSDGSLYALRFNELGGATTGLEPLNLAGDAEPGNRVTILIDDVEAGTVITDEDGRWRFSGFVPAGPRTVRAIVLNRSGNPEIVSEVATINVGDVTNDLEATSSDSGLLRILFSDPSLSGEASGGEGDAGSDSDSGESASVDGSSGIDLGAALSGSPAVELIVDASWSMTFPLDSDAEEDRLTVDDPDSRIQIAKSALNTFIDNNLPIGSPVAVRAFGNIEGDLACRTDLMLPLQPITQEALREIIDDIEPQFNANTAIAASLAAVADDLAGTDREKVVVLLTDGAETCEGDPAAEIERLVDSGIDITVNIIGFAISDLDLKAQFEEWATLGNGQYIDAQDAETLSVALRETLTVNYVVLDPSGNEVASGVVGGQPIELEPGSYTVILASREATEIENVIITPGGVSELISAQTQP